MLDIESHPLKDWVKDDLVLFGQPTDHYEEEGAHKPPVQLLEVSICASPDKLESLGRFLIECAADLRTEGESFGHAHWRDTIHKPDVIVCPPEDFAALFNMRVDGRDEVTLARLCKVSIPTIRRWMNGTSSPHPLLRSAIFAALDKPAP